MCEVKVARRAASLVVVASGVVVGFNVSGVGDVSVAWRLVAA